MKIIIIIYINDLLIAGLNWFIINKFKNAFKIKFKIIDLVFYIYYLNIKITRDC